MNDALLLELFRADAERADALEENAAPVSFSPAFEKRMDALCARMRTGRYRRVYGKTKALLIAAVVAVLLMTVTAGAVWYRATVRYDPDWGDNVFHVEGGRDDGLPADPRPAYIPAKFNVTIAETKTDDGYQLLLHASDGSDLAVTVRTADTDHLIDAERGENEWIELDGKRYYRRRAVTETEPRVYTTILIDADDRYIVTAAVWDQAGYADDGELARIIGSVSVK